MTERRSVVPRAVALALAAVTVTATAADLANGRRVYTLHCAACHGANGISVMPTAPHFARNEKLFQPDNAIAAAIRAGRNAMPAYGGILNDREIFDVVAYLRTLHP